MKYIIAVDYDGTLFTESYPILGDPVIPVFKKIKEFQAEGAEIVLWTCREAGTLQEAIDRCKENGLEFDAVNDNAPSHSEYATRMLKENGHIFANRKIYANIYVDDKSPGSIEYFLQMNAENVCNAKSVTSKRETLGTATINDLQKDYTTDTYENQNVKG